MSDLMKYNSILPKDDDYHLWYDSLKGWRLNIRGVGNSPFNAEAEILFEIERERIIKLLENLADITTNHQHKLGVLEAVACIKFNTNHAALIKGENND